MKRISAEQLREMLSYDPETGVFTWTKQMGPKNAGSIAGGSRADGYCRIGINGVRYRSHLLAWLYMTGEWQCMTIDHLDGDPFNNKFSNLRHVSASENQRNRRLQSNNTTGYTGVSFCRTKKKFRAYAKVNGRSRSLGYFTFAEDAADASLAFRLKNGFTERHGCADSQCPGRGGHSAHDLWIVQHLPAEDTEGGDE